MNNKSCYLGLSTCPYAYFIYFPYFCFPFCMLISFGVSGKSYFLSTGTLLITRMFYGPAGWVGWLGAIPNSRGVCSHISLVLFIYYTLTRAHLDSYACTLARGITPRSFGFAATTAPENVQKRPERLCQRPPDTLCSLQQPHQQPKHVCGKTHGR